MKLRATLLAFTTLSMPILALPVASHAEDVYGGWDINGSNTLRWENYNLDGDRTASPYMTGGSHYFNEIDLNVDKQFSQYRRLRGQLSGVVNNSDYRQTSDGIVPERFHLTYEDGETGTPFRAEAGDYFANVSYRTLQKSLKGGSVEFQPDLGGSQAHSLVLFNGSQQPDYRRLDFSEDYWQGASWLIEDAVWGRFSFNTLWNSRDQQAFAIPGTENAEQNINSAAFSTPFDLASQRFTAEGEVAAIAGDTGSTAALQDKSEMGYFGQLASYGTGDLQPLDYRLRFEQYGADYSNTGSVVTANRKSEEAHAGWRFDNGFRLRGRAQSFHDNFDASLNQLDTNVIGGGVSGPVAFLWVPEGSTVDVDAYQQDGEDELLTTNYIANTLNINGYSPINEQWTVQKNLFLQFFEDNTIINRDRETKQLGFSFIRTLQCDEWSGSIGPGFVLRAIDGPLDESFELEPTLTFDMSNGTHNFSMSYGYLNQDRDMAGTPDLATQTFGLDYRYLMGNNEFGAYASIYDREVDAGLDTEADRVGVYWTYHFDQPASASNKIATTTVADTYDETGQIEAPVLDLDGNTPKTLAAPAAEVAAAPKGAALIAALKLGGPVKAAEASIAKAGYGKPSTVGGSKVYSLRLLTDIPQRQRLALEGREGELTRTVLLVDLDDRMGATIEQAYARVRDSLINAYGRPAEVYDEGKFGASAASDIASNRVIRTTEWETDQGTLRLGIPHRTDGLLRLEVQHAASLPSPRANRWGSLTR